MASRKKSAETTETNQAATLVAAAVQNDSVFFSWQSDALHSVNRYFVEDCLNRAVKKINGSSGMKTAHRQLSVDHSTLGEPGSPPITDTILGKIDKSFAFVADLTLVGKATKKVTKDAPGSRGVRRPMPNPNVMLEYGWALKSLSHRRIIGVMNERYGAVTEQSIPFDLRHARWPLRYTLKPGATTEAKQETRDKLTAQLVSALEHILGSGAGATNAPAVVADSTVAASPGIASEALRRNKDLSVLRWVLEQIHLATMDRFVQRAQEADQVIWDVFNYWEDFDGAVRSSYFHVYDDRLNVLIQALDKHWGAALGFGVWFESSPDPEVFKLMPMHRASSRADWYAAQRAFHESIVATQVAWRDLLAYVRDEYPEIDIEAASQKALERNRKFQADADDLFGQSEDGAPTS